MSVTFGEFTIERTYPVPVERVWFACTNAEAKAAWFPSSPEDQTREFDFRVGGREHNEGVHEGTTFVYDATYADIVVNERFVCTYAMLLNGRRISVSVATMQLHAEDDATRVVYTEQGAFLDGFDKPEIREHGTRELFEALGVALAASGSHQTANL